MSERGFIDGEYQDGDVRGLTFVAGERGMGKTTLTIGKVEQCTGPVVFFDTVGTHAALLRPRGFVEISQPGTLQEYLLRNLGKRARVVYVPRDEQPEMHVTHACTIVRAVGVELTARMGDAGGLILAIDEIDQFCGAEYGAKWMPTPLYNLAHFGRHYHVSMLCTARDPKSLSKKFRSQCAQMCIFRVSEEDDVKYFRARIGRANAERLPLLQKTYYLHWHAGATDAQVCGGPRKI